MPSSKMPGIIRTVIIGTLFSVIASLVIESSALLLEVLRPHSDPTSSDLIGSAWNVIKNVQFAVFFVILVLLGAWFRIVPTIISGGVIGFTLRSLAYHDHLNNIYAGIVGGLIGLSMGWASAVFIYPTISIAHQMGPSAEPIWAGVEGVLEGLLSSLLLARWLRRHASLSSQMTD